MRILKPAVVAFACMLSPLAAAQDVDVLEDRPAEQSLALGLGALWFMEQDMVPVDGPTPAWSLRYSYDGGSMVGMEVAWIGNTGLERTDHMRITNLFEAGLKLLVAPTAAVTPFASAGLGYGAFFGAPENTDLVTVTLPLSGGVEIRADDFMIAGRATWRQTFADETAFTSLGANHVTATIELGQRF